MDRNVFTNKGLDMTFDNYVCLERDIGLKSEVQLLALCILGIGTTEAVSSLPDVYHMLWSGWLSRAQMHSQ